jgi:hypothetical protein
MATPPPGNGGGAECRLGRRTSSTFRCKSQLLPVRNSPVVIVDGRTVRIVGAADSDIGLPRRQSFAWPTNARKYAEQLSVERGWPIEVLRG